MDFRPGGGGRDVHGKFFERLTDSLCAYASHVARYDVSDENGETRRQRNERFGQPVPETPDVTGGEHLVVVFGALRRLAPATWGGFGPITPGVILDWMALTGTRLSLAERSILLAMDSAFLSAASVDSKQS